MAFLFIGSKAFSTPVDWQQAGTALTDRFFAGFSPSSGPKQVWRSMRCRQLCATHRDMAISLAEFAVKVFLPPHAIGVARRKCWDMGSEQMAELRPIVQTYGQPKVVMAHSRPSDYCGKEGAHCIIWSCMREEQTEQIFFLHARFSGLQVWHCEGL
nr:hypothetical protein [Neorhizobium galegae]